MSSAGFMKKSDTWYREDVEAILVVNLQKSDFGPSRTDTSSPHVLNPSIELRYSDSPN
jgi:hypothetical protein